MRNRNVGQEVDQLNPTQSEGTFERRNNKYVNTIFIMNFLSGLGIIFAGYH